MTFSRVAQRSHLVRGPGGLAGEVFKLRQDVADALEDLSADEFDVIGQYLPLSSGSPNNIGPAVNLAFAAAALYGNNATLLIKPRRDGLAPAPGAPTNVWGWTTPTANLLPISGAQSYSLTVMGVPHQTQIWVGTGLTNLCEIGDSNATCAFRDLAFIGDPTPGVNAQNILYIRQARIGLMTRCSFWGISCDGVGVVKIVADTTHVADSQFGGCNYAGTLHQGGCLSIIGERDASLVESLRFDGVDGTFRGVVCDKGDPTANVHLYYGAQGLDGAVTPYGEVTTRNCIFAADALFHIDHDPGVGSILDHARVVGCGFAGQSSLTSAPIRFAHGHQLVVEGSQFSNSAADQYAIWFEGRRLIVKESHAATGGKKILFTGPTHYVEIDNCDWPDPTEVFSFDTSVATPDNGIIRKDGCTLRIFGASCPTITIAPDPDWGTLVATVTETESVQWYRGNVPIVGATNLSYSTGSVPGVSTDFGPGMSCIATGPTGLKHRSNVLIFDPNEETTPAIHSWTDPRTITPGVNQPWVDSAAAGGYGTFTRTAGTLTASATSLNGTPAVTGSAGGYMDSSSTVDLSAVASVCEMVAVQDATAATQIISSHCAAAGSIVANIGTGLVVNDVTVGSWSGFANGTGAGALGETRTGSGAPNDLGAPCVIEIEFKTAEAGGVNITTNPQRVNGVDQVQAVSSPLCVAGNLGNGFCTLFASRAGAIPWAGTMGHRIVFPATASAAMRSRLRNFILYCTGLPPA